MLPSPRLAYARTILDRAGHSVPSAAYSESSDSAWHALLASGSIHEWFDGAAPAWSASQAPVGVAALAAHAKNAATIVWIGERCRPFGAGLARRFDALLRNSVFVHVPRRTDRLWAIDIALRCPGVDAVIADASGLTMPESRRLQLAAESGRTLGLLLRPPQDLACLSVARTRWRLTPLATDTRDPHWTLQLLRCKGLRPTDKDARRWIVRQSHATSDVHLVPEASGRSLAASGPARCIAL